MQEPPFACLFFVFSLLESVWEDLSVFLCIRKNDLKPSHILKKEYKEMQKNKKKKLTAFGGCFHEIWKLDQ